MEQILEFITRYGLPVFVIASCIIAVIGILKLCKVFDKIKSADVKKCIYYILNFVLAFGGVAIYFGIFHISFSGYVVFAFTQVTATTTLYSIYEHFGVRKLVRMFINWLALKFKKDPNCKVVKTLKSLGLTEDAIVRVQNAAGVEIIKQSTEVNKQ